MKLKNIAKKSGKEINLQIGKYGKVVVPNQEFEVDDAKGKKLLNQKIDNNPIVEKVKEEKVSKEA